MMIPRNFADGPRAEPGLFGAGGWQTVDPFRHAGPFDEIIIRDIRLDIDHRSAVDGIESFQSEFSPPSFQQSADRQADGVRPVRGTRREHPDQWQIFPATGMDLEMNPLSA